ncbi:anti-sigma factor domain-containing protein [Rossellomorea vietnamensis]|uniref:Anti-sigma factor domain-containing protein n=1 Tax=Rossellomorea vietnamensis TaxID=218284 RepID=A0A5D4KN57_9BACI|nr:anti-sigma factor domain-containing protein [Rossellomorea vietnamensis]TYR77743.1 anti-sigma factor domain-containing protein [Rossellomorea vietnamensis]
MKKGIVMEVKPNTIVMMTPEGEFIKTKKQPSVQYELGEELTFFPQTCEGSSPGIFKKLKEIRMQPVISGAAALLMLLFIFLPILKEPDVYAYVSVDINPSFELSIDQDKEVVDVKAFNEEARKMLQQMTDPEGKSIVAVTDEIIDLSSQEGYMDDDKKVTVTTVFTKEAKTRDKSSIEEAIKRFSTEKLKEDTVAISLIDSNFEVREEAAAAGMTAGQLIKKKEEAQMKKVPKEVKEKAPATPSKTENSKVEDRKELPKEIPSKEDKKPPHAKEKQAEKGKSGANPAAKGTKSNNGASEKKKEDSNKNNGSGKGRNPNASESKASPPSHNEEKRGNGSSHNQKEQQKSNGSSSSHPKQKEEQRGKGKENRNERNNDGNEHHGPSKNDKEKGNRN